MKVKPEDKADFDMGLLFDPVPEILTHWHSIIHPPRASDPKPAEGLKEAPVRVNNNTCFAIHNRTRLTNFNPGFKVKKKVFWGRLGAWNFVLKRFKGVHE